jgi:two-component system, NarL family, response regulator DevR
MRIPRERLITILLVDDHEVVRIGLRALLDAVPGFRVVGEGATKREGIRGAIRLKPTVALLDIRLPDGSGIDVAREILSACPTTNVAFLTSYADDDSVLAAVLSGAQGYILKDIGSDNLIKGIRTVASGKPLLDPRLTNQTRAWIKNLSAAHQMPSTLLLSPQEQRLLPLIAEGHTNKEIAEVMQLSEKTVKNYLANLFSKLHISRRSQAAAFYVRRSISDTTRAE